MKEKTANGLAKVFVFLFSLPFALVGLFTGFLFLRLVLVGSSDVKQYILFGIFSLVFGGVGLGLMFACFFGFKILKEEKKLQDQFPLEPWKWKKKWISGKIEGQTKAAMIGTWIFATFWNLISFPVLWVIPEEIIKKSNYLALIGLIFPMIGLGLIGMASYLTVRWKKFGKTFFNMNTFPGVIGGKLQGEILVNKNLMAVQKSKLRLLCIHKTVSRSGKDSHSREDILWEEEMEIPREQLTYLAEKTGIPVDFSIPFSCKQTDFTIQDNQIIWRLEVGADLIGVDFKTAFEIPVFKTEESNHQITNEVLAKNYITQMLPPLFSGIEIKPFLMGGKEVFFQPARHLGVALGLTLFFVIWVGFIVLMIHKKIPFMFPMVFGLFAILIGIFILELWFGTTRLIFQPNEVLVQNGYLGGGPKKRVLYDEISKVQTKRGMQSGRTLYYDLEIIRKNGKKISAGRNIKEKSKAAWLVNQMQNWIKNRG